MNNLPGLLGFAPGTLAIWAASALRRHLCARIPAVDARPATAPSRRGLSESVLRDLSPNLLFARRLYYAYVFSILLASFLLLTRLISHDFRISYVASYSGRDLPFYYLFSTFWAGQEGSFMLWLFWGSLIGLFVLRSAKEQEAPVMVVYLASFLGIVAILVKQSPFRFLAQIPPDGQGLNPLLQDPWMVIHPPVMFSGFASLSVPFAFAIGALWMKRWDGWVVRAMPWALFTFVTLGTAILMGGYWAYKTLGWGGYWGWDPVENTSLVPWLATVALVHGMFLQKMRAKHRKINIILAILAFCCILYGTFLTRSGVLADFSVHSFIDLGITGWLVGIIVVFLVGGLGLLAWRWKEIPVVSDVDAATGKEKEEPFLSRSVLFILSVTLFCASGLVILLGTSAPILTRVARQGVAGRDELLQRHARADRGSHGPAPPLVPYLSWRGESGKGVLRKALVPGVVVGFSASGSSSRPACAGRGDLLILAFAVAGFVANAETAILFVRRKAVKTMGGYLAHIGMSIMLVGILISGVYEKRTTVNLVRNQPVSVGSNTLTFTRTVFVTDRRRREALRGAERDGPLGPPRQAGDGGRGVVARRERLEGLSEALHEHAHEPDDGEPRREVVAAHGPLHLSPGVRPGAVRAHRGHDVRPEEGRFEDRRGREGEVPRFFGRPLAGLVGPAARHGHRQFPRDDRRGLGGEDRPARHVLRRASRRNPRRSRRRRLFPERAA